MTCAIAGGRRSIRGPHPLLGVILVVAALTCSGCVDPFSGSYTHLNLKGFRSPCELIALHEISLPPTWKPCSGDPIADRTLFHFELFATVDRMAVFKVMDFAVQRAIYPEEHESLEKDGILLPSGKPFRASGTLPLSDMTAAESAVLRKSMRDASAVYGITSYSQTRLADDGRLASDYYLGNPRNINQPINGVFHGQVEGPPVGGGPFAVGGTTGTLPFRLERLDALMITLEQGPADRKPATPSDVVLVAGTATRNIRGALNADLVSTLDSAISATFLAFPNLDQRENF